MGKRKEGHSFERLFLGQPQAGAVAGSQQRPVFFGKRPADDGADGMQDVFCREIVAPGDLRLAGRLLVSLLPHDLGAFFPQLQTRRRVDDVVDAVMPGTKAAQKLGIGRVHNGVRVQPGDIPLPEDDALIRGDGGKLRDVNDAPCVPLRPKQRILFLQEAQRQRPGFPYVHQAAQEIPPALFIGRDPLRFSTVLRHFVQQHFGQI